MFKLKILSYVRSPISGGILCKDRSNCSTLNVVHRLRKNVILKSKHPLLKKKVTKLELTLVRVKYFKGCFYVYNTTLTSPTYTRP